MNRCDAGAALLVVSFVGCGGGDSSDVERVRVYARARVNGPDRQSGEKPATGGF